MSMAIRDPQYGGYRVFVGDLGPKVLKQDLEKAFEQFGRLLDCWVARNPPGHAFLLFKYPREAERAVERMEGSMVSGRRIRVEHARPHDVRMKDISRRGGTVSHSHTISRDRYGGRPKETSHKGPRPRDRGGNDWPPSHSRQWPSHPRKSPPSRHHSDHYDHYRRRRSWSHEHDRYKRRRSEEARDRSPRDWPPRDRSPRDRSPRDWPPRGRSPRDRSPRDRSARDRSPRDRSPRYRSPKDRSPSDRNYYEDRDGTGSRGSQKLMSVAALVPKKVVMKTDQGNQTDTEFLAAMSGQVQDSCSRAVEGEQTTPESKEKPAIQSSSPVNGTVTADVKCGPEVNEIDKADDKNDKLAPVSSKADDNQTLKESSCAKDVASSKSGEQAKPEMSDSSCGLEESNKYGKNDGEKSKGHLELNRPRISLCLPPAKHRRSSSTQAQTSPNSVSSSKHRRSSSTQAPTSPSPVSNTKHRRSSSTQAPTSPSSVSNTKHRRSSSTQAQTSPSSASGSRHRESSSIQIQTSPSSASGATSGRRHWSGSDSESDMSEGENEVSVTGGDVNGNEEVDVNCEKVQRESEMVKRKSEEMVKKDSEEMVKKHSEEMVKKDSEEKVKKDSKKTVKDDSEELTKRESVEKVNKDSEEMMKKNNKEMVKKDSEEMVKKDSEEMVKKDTESSEQMDTLDIPLPEITLP